MNALPIENGKSLAEEMGWTLERAEGYVEGERYRRGRLALSEYHKVGIDEYALGFRAGYFRRGKPVPVVKIETKSSVR
jgi:hypothetical protein